VRATHDSRARDSVSVEEELVHFLRRMHATVLRHRPWTPQHQGMSSTGGGPTFLGAPHDNLPAEQGLKAGGATKNGQGPLAYPCSSEAQNCHGERHVLRMATWKPTSLPTTFR